MLSKAKCLKQPWKVLETQQCDVSPKQDIQQEQKAVWDLKSLIFLWKITKTNEQQHALQRKQC